MHGMIKEKAKHNKQIKGMQQAALLITGVMCLSARLEG